jgi:hypothetical protein
VRLEQVRGSKFESHNENYSFLIIVSYLESQSYPDEIESSYMTHQLILREYL